MTIATHNRRRGVVRSRPVKWPGFQVARSVTPVMRRDQGFGDTEPWSRWWASPAEVYVWRARLKNAEIGSPADALRILRSVAEAQTDSLELDARAIALGADGRVDVIFTADSTRPYGAAVDALDIAQTVRQDPSLRTLWPQLDVTSPVWLELTGPPQATDFWRSRPILIDDTVGVQDAFAKQQGVFQGAADDGDSAQAWTGSEPPLEPPEPSPPSEPSSKLPQILLAATVTAAVVYAAATVLTQERTR